MKSLKTILAAALVLGLVLLAAQAREPRDKLMQRKLTNSQKVLEGIALSDFQMIEKHAEELLQISKEASWKVLNTPAYQLHSNDFRRQAEALIKNSREKNLDAAALTYVEMTLTCVKCHKHVREVRMTAFEQDN
jgi:hypothetical protein